MTYKNESAYPTLRDHRLDGLIIALTKHGHGKTRKRYDEHQIRDTNDRHIFKVAEHRGFQNGQARY